MTRSKSEKRKATIRDLSREHATAEEHKAVMELLTRGPQNSTAILGASIVEQELEISLRERFRRKDDKTWRAITDENGPLGTLYAKIMAGYAFGLYDDNFCENLHIMRRIRNAFAHAKKLIAFDHELIIAEFKKIRVPTRSRGLYGSIIKTVRHTELPKSSYIILCLALMGDLMKKRFQRHTANQRRRSRRPARGALRGPYREALLRALRGDPIEVPIDSPKSSLPHQNAGPNIQEDQDTLPAIYRVTAASLGKKGK